MFKTISKFLLLSFFAGIFSCTSIKQQITQAPRERWNENQASSWYADQPWLVGANFLPSTAINQLEMFRTVSFDPETLTKNLGTPNLLA